VFKGGYQDVPSKPGEADKITSGTADNARPTEKQTRLGIAIADLRFTEGRISVDVEFDEITPPPQPNAPYYSSIAEIILQYEPTTGSMINVGMGGHPHFLTGYRFWGPAQTQQAAGQQAPNWYWYN